jgi:hypothetical protein
MKTTISKLKRNLVPAFVMAVTSYSVSASNQQLSGITNDLDLNFRYRVEAIDQQNFDKNALASTLRTRATIKTKWNAAFDSVLEFDDVSDIFSDDFNSGAGTSPNRTQYPVVAEPSGTEVNQVFIRLTYSNNKVAYGRQRILLDNQRFVGGVGWRQNEQTFDSLTYKLKINEAFSFDYAYIFNVNRIFGETVNAGDHLHDTNLISAVYQPSFGKLTGYYFDIDNKDALAMSNTTVGVKFAGKLADVSYTLEYANQSDNGNNPNNYDASYFLLETNYKIGSGSIGIGTETLGGDRVSGQAFTTSLATLHKFQGWADVFLATPVSGIKDSYFMGSYNLNGYGFKAVYHDFSTDQQSVALGTEMDFSLSKKIGEHFSWLLKLASFNSDNVSYQSRDKIWLMFSYKI